MDQMNDLPFVFKVNIPDSVTLVDKSWIHGQDTITYTIRPTNHPKSVNNNQPVARIFLACFEVGVTVRGRATCVELRFRSELPSALVFLSHHFSSATPNV